MKNNFGVDSGSRKSGILMPFRAMPGDHDHQGTLGPESTEFLNYMNEAGFTVLQDLPNSPPDPFESPYSSVSAFALDPQRIDLFQLAELGDINRFDLSRYQKLVLSGDAGPAIREEKVSLLRKAFLGFSDTGSPERHEAFVRWYKEESEWLDSFAAYEILKNLPENSDWRWQNWNIGKDFSPALVAELKAHKEEDFATICYEQWVANEQTLAYIGEASQRGIEVWGDVPFYVGGGETWANREVFNLDSEGNQVNQGGAAPSMTSATGQVWGFATYKHGGAEDPAQTAKVVQWWNRRLNRASKLSGGMVRLDHFIGFAEPYIIAVDAKDGTNGHRDAGIGDELLATLAKTYGANLPFYPEDLGTQTDKTPELRDRYGLARNTLLVRSFTKHLVLDEYDESFHNPDNYHKNSVNISSNHDSPPLIEALDDIRAQFPAKLGSYITYISQKFPHVNINKDTSSAEIAALEMERCIRSVGKYAIIGIWDALRLGREGRYNVPDTISPKNWSWRMDSEQSAMLSSQAAYWRALNELSGRLPSQREVSAAAD